MVAERLLLNSLLNHADTLRARADLSDTLYKIARENPDKAERLIKWVEDPEVTAELDDTLWKGAANYIAEVLRDALAHNPDEYEPIILSTVVANFWRKLRGN